MSNAATVNLHAAGVRKKVRAWIVRREARIQEEKNKLVSAAYAAQVPADPWQFIRFLCRRPYKARTLEDCKASLSEEFQFIEITGGLWAGYAKQLDAAASLALSAGDKFICVPIEWVQVFNLNSPD